MRKVNSMCFTEFKAKVVTIRQFINNELRIMFEFYPYFFF